MYHKKQPSQTSVSTIPITSRHHYVPDRRIGRSVLVILTVAVLAIALLLTSMNQTVTLAAIVASNDHEIVPTKAIAAPLSQAAPITVITISIDAPDTFAASELGTWHVYDRPEETLLLWAVEAPTDFCIPLWLREQFGGLRKGFARADDSYGRR